MSLNEYSLLDIDDFDDLIVRDIENSESKNTYDKNDTSFIYRKKVIIYIRKVCKIFSFSFDVLLNAIEIYDRLIQHTNISVIKLVPTACICLLLSRKFHHDLEIDYNITFIQKHLKYDFEYDTLLKMERTILDKIGYNVFCILPSNYTLYFNECSLEENIEPKLIYQFYTYFSMHKIFIKIPVFIVYCCCHFSSLIYQQTENPTKYSDLVLDYGVLQKSKLIFKMTDNLQNIYDLTTVFLQSND